MLVVDWPPPEQEKHPSRGADTIEHVVMIRGRKAKCMRCRITPEFVPGPII
jgi:hypothetical protein